jgi:hypothetical protein
MGVLRHPKNAPRLAASDPEAVRRADAAIPTDEERARLLTELQPGIEKIRHVLIDLPGGELLFVQRPLLNAMGKILLERFSHLHGAGLDDEASALLDALPNAEVATRLLEKDPAFILHPLVGFFLLSARDGAIANARHPQISTRYDDKLVHMRYAAQLWERMVAALVPRHSRADAQSRIDPAHFLNEDEWVRDQAETLALGWVQAQKRGLAIDSPRELDERIAAHAGGVALFGFADEIVAENIMVSKQHHERAAGLELARRFGWLPIPYSAHDAERALATVKRMRNRMRQRASEHEQSAAQDELSRLRVLRAEYDTMRASGTWPEATVEQLREARKLAAKHGVPAAAAELVAKPYPAWKQALAAITALSTPAPRGTEE